MKSGTYEYQSDFARKYFAEGRSEGLALGEAKGLAVGEAKGRAQAVVHVLRARSIPVGELLQSKILACTDTAVIDRWIERAVTVSSAEQLFDD